MTRWYISNADLLDARADGLLCSANPNLNLSGGVGGALLLRYGPEMQDFLHTYLRSTGRRFIDPGSAVLAPARGTPYKAIAHAVAIDAFYETNGELIRSAYENALGQLAAAGCRTVAAACLACGYGRCSSATFVKAIEPLIAASYPPVQTITLTTTNQELAEALAELVGVPLC